MQIKQYEPFDQSVCRISPVKKGVKKNDCRVLLAARCCELLLLLFLFRHFRVFALEFLKILPSVHESDVAIHANVALSKPQTRGCGQALLIWVAFVFLHSLAVCIEMDSGRKNLLDFFRGCENRDIINGRVAEIFIVIRL